MKRLALISLMCVPLLTNAQDCTCVENYNWVKSTFEENDAGYTYALEQKGEEAFRQHNILFDEKIKKISNPLECTQTIYQWLTFFRSGHLGIRLINQNNDAAEPQDNNTIIEQYKDWEKVSVNIDEFKKGLKNKKADGFEGIWESAPYTMGVIKQGDDYVGFIIEADGVYWTPGQVKFRILKTKNGYKSTYYMRDHSGQEFDEAVILGNNFIQTGFITLKRIDSKLPTSKEIEKYFKSINATKPYFEQIDKKTALLRIPSFSFSEKKAIDSVIAANKSKILSTENLIIDIQNNGGGSDSSYEELLPFLYTNPIRTVGLEFYSTPTNNARMEQFMNDPDFSDEDRKWAKESLVELNKNIGEFVSLSDEIVTVETFDEVTPFPKNVGVIINEGNGSTSEQFLLAVKQSRKVKLFGTTTVGVLDISNMHFLKSPCNTFELGYSLTRSFRIPDFTIDDKGIQPDYYINKTIPKHEWVPFVHEILNTY